MGSRRGLSGLDEVWERRPERMKLLNSEQFASLVGANVFLVPVEDEDSGLVSRLRNLAPVLDDLLRQTRQLCDEVADAARRAKETIVSKRPPYRKPRRRRLL